MAHIPLEGGTKRMCPNYFPSQEANEAMGSPVTWVLPAWTKSFPAPAKRISTTTPGFPTLSSSMPLVVLVSVFS